MGFEPTTPTLAMAESKCSAPYLECAQVSHRAPEFKLIGRRSALQN
jgi:hypothetical protein